MDAAEAKFFARLDCAEELAAPTAESPRGVNPAIWAPGSVRSPHRQPVDALWRQMWWQFAAAILLVLALGVSLYRIGLKKGEETAASPAPAPAPDKFDPWKAVVPADDAPAPTSAERAESAPLRAQPKSRTDEIAWLEAEKAHLEQRLLATQNGSDHLAEITDQMGRNLEATEAELETARQQLAIINNRDSADTARIATLEHEIEDLKSKGDRKDHEFSREQELLEHDRDIRELMGSRKLYVAEVYDVAKNGEPQRPFGRVFCTEGKSLVFYAYDLDQQPGVREASSFQAWGRKGPDTTHAVNLGIFYVDNAVNKRWVLKSHDPKVLTNIDAVFVTVEPHGGSDHPSGKPLLFAYLRVEPNHP